MATTGAQPADLPVPVEDIVDSASSACWAVEDHGWKELVPGLPDEMIDLLAPPVVVTAEGVAPTPSAAKPVPAVVFAPASTRLLVPALPRRLRRSV